MEKRILQNLLWMLVCLLALSCQKDDRIDGEAAVTEASLSGEVQRAKQWLEQWQAANRYG